MDRIKYCGNNGHYLNATYYEDALDFFKKDGSYLIERSYYISISEKEIRVFSGGYSRHHVLEIILEGETEEDRERKPKQYMYMPGGCTYIFSIDDDNDIQMGGMSHIG